MAHRTLLLTSFCAFLVAGCGMDHGGGAGAPAAPTGLTAEPLTGGAHLTWTDNADDETQYMVMRMADGDADYTTIMTLPFDTTAYHDAPVTSGTTYLYMVMAMNDEGESESNEVEFAAP